jgi:hypothetical protein
MNAGRGQAPAGRAGGRSRLVREAALAPRQARRPPALDFPLRWFSGGAESTVGSIVGGWLSTKFRSRPAGEAGAGAERGVWAYPLSRADPAATTLPTAAAPPKADAAVYTRSPKYRLPPLEARLRPKLLGVVIRIARGDVGRQSDPRQLGAGVDVDVWRERRRLIERPRARRKAPERRRSGSTSLFRRTCSGECDVAARCRLELQRPWSRRTDSPPDSFLSAR